MALNYKSSVFILTILFMIWNCSFQFKLEILYCINLSTVADIEWKNLWILMINAILNM